MSQCEKMSIMISHLPPSDNTVYRRRGGYGMYLTPEGKAWKELVSRLALKSTPFKGKVAVRLVFTFTDNRRRDAQNHQKLTLDALQGYFYDDDSQIHHLTVIKRHGEKPMTLIECEPI